MKKMFLFLLLFILSCSSMQVLDKKADNDLLKVEEGRTKIIIDIIKESKLSDNDKKLLINEFNSKDMIIKSLNERIQAYQQLATQSQNKSDTVVTQTHKEEIKCMKDAGFGIAFKWILGIVVFLAIVFIVYILATKTSVLGLIFGNKKP